MWLEVARNILSLKLNVDYFQRTDGLKQNMMLSEDSQDLNPSLYPLRNIQQSFLIPVGIVVEISRVNLAAGLTVWIMSGDMSPVMFLPAAKIAIKDEVKVCQQTNSNINQESTATESIINNSGQIDLNPV